jgi:hypothetical protein
MPPLISWSASLMVMVVINSDFDWWKLFSADGWFPQLMDQQRHDFSANPMPSVWSLDSLSYP